MLCFYCGFEFWWIPVIYLLIFQVKVIRLVIGLLYQFPSTSVATPWDMSKMDWYLNQNKNTTKWEMCAFFCYMIYKHFREQYVAHKRSNWNMKLMYHDCCGSWVDMILIMQVLIFIDIFLVASLMSLMASLVTTSRMQQCFNVPIDSYHEFLLLFYCCVLLEIKLTTTTDFMHWLYFYHITIT